MITATARDDDAGIVIEVGPGGTVCSFSLADRAMRLDGEHLAAAILRLARTATAQANRRAALTIPGASPSTLDALGLGHDPTMDEAAEQTTPDTWMR